MRKDAYRIAVVGAAGLIGRALVRSLYEREFPIVSLQLVDVAEMVGEEIEAGEGSVIVEAIEGGIGPADLVFIAADAGVNPDEVFSLAGSDAVVIDLSGRCALEEDVPLIVPEYNRPALSLYSSCRVVASPDPVAVALGVVLGPLHEHAGLRRAVVTALDPVSGAGAAGIDELSRETVELLNGRSVDPDVFPQRIAFNVLPWSGPLGESGETAAEERAAGQLRKILDDPAIEVSISRVCVPTFYGLGMTVNAELGRHLDRAEAQHLLRSAPGVIVTDAEDWSPASIADAVEQAATLVSRIREDQSVENGLNLWIAIDNLRKGQAINAVQIAEILVQDYL